MSPGLELTRDEGKGENKGTGNNQGKHGTIKKTLGKNQGKHETVTR